MGTRKPEVATASAATEDDPSVEGANGSIKTSKVNKLDPTQVPKNGHFYFHDSRRGDSRRKKRDSKSNKKDEGVWKRDMFAKAELQRQRGASRDRGRHGNAPNRPKKNKTFADAKPAANVYNSAENAKVPSVAVRASPTANLQKIYAKKGAFNDNSDRLNDIVEIAENPVKKDHYAGEVIYDTEKGWVSVNTVLDDLSRVVVTERDISARRKWQHKPKHRSFARDGNFEEKKALLPKESPIITKGRKQFHRNTSYSASPEYSPVHHRLPMQPAPRMIHMAPMHLMHQHPPPHVPPAMHFPYMVSVPLHAPPMQPYHAPYFVPPPNTARSTPAHLSSPAANEFLAAARGAAFRDITPPSQNSSKWVVDQVRRQLGAM